MNWACGGPYIPTYSYRLTSTCQSSNSRGLIVVLSFVANRIALKTAQTWRPIMLPARQLLLPAIHNGTEIRGKLKMLWKCGAAMIGVVVIVGGSAGLHNNIENQHRLGVIISTVQWYANYGMNIEWYLTVVKFISRLKEIGCVNLLLSFFSLQTKHFFIIQPRIFLIFQYLWIYCRHRFAHLYSSIVRVSLRSSASGFIFHVLAMTFCKADQFYRQFFV